MSNNFNISFNDSFSSSETVITKSFRSTTLSTFVYFILYAELLNYESFHLIILLALRFLNRLELFYHIVSLPID